MDGAGRPRRDRTVTAAHALAVACRRSTLELYGILDTPREREFDEITEVAAAVCDVPIALVSLIDADRQWFKSAVGLGIAETTLDNSICAFALAGDDFLEITDTRLDPRTLANPFVVAEPHLRFYAGAVLRSPEGVPFGTLCVLDMKPRALTDLQRNTLRVLARQVVKELELRRAMRRQEFLQREVDHRVKNSLQSVASFVRLQAHRADSEETRAALEAVGRRVSSVALLHHELYSVAVDEQIALEHYMTKVAALFTASAPENVTVEVDFAPVRVTSEQATALAAIANEVVTNAFKHAFPDGRSGTVTITGTAAGDGLVTVRMADDGVGVDGTIEATGLGVRIIEASAQQMGATLTFDTAGPGVALTIAFPILRPAAVVDGEAVAVDGEAAPPLLARTARG